MRDAIAKDSLKGTDFVFKQGFSDWKPLKDVPELENSQSDIRSTSSRRHFARAELKERVIVHNGDEIVSGQITNISEAGLFIETNQQKLPLEDEVSITIKSSEHLGMPLQLRGKIVRWRSERPCGYGIKLLNVDESVHARIAEYVKNNHVA